MTQQTTTIATVLDALRDERTQINVAVADRRYNVRTYEVHAFCDALRSNDTAALACFADSFNDRLSDDELAATLQSDARAADAHAQQIARAVRDVANMSAAAHDARRNAERATRRAAHVSAIALIVFVALVAFAAAAIDVTTR